MKPTATFTAADRSRLGRLVYSGDDPCWAGWAERDDLAWRLEQCDAVDQEMVDDDVVTMNSTVRLINARTGAEASLTVVYPEEVELVDDGVSVLDPLGSRLVGCEVGDLLECNYAGERGPWRIMEVTYQPERAEAFHL